MDNLLPKCGDFESPSVPIIIENSDIEIPCNIPTISKKSSISDFSFDISSITTPENNNECSNEILNASTKISEYSIQIFTLQQKQSKNFQRYVIHKPIQLIYTLSTNPIKIFDISEDFTYEGICDRLTDYLSLWLENGAYFGNIREGLGINESVIKDSNRFNGYSSEISANVPIFSEGKDNEKNAKDFISLLGEIKKKYFDFDFFKNQIERDCYLFSILDNGFDSSFLNIFETSLLVVKDYEDRENEIISLQNKIAKTLKYLNNLPCVLLSKSNNDNIQENLNDWEYDKDSLIAIEKSPFVIKYWLKWSSILNIVSLNPLYYPIGVILPNGSKIPFPVIWTPLSVVKIDNNINVLFLTICGTVISPFVWMLNAGENDFMGISGKMGSGFIVGTRGKESITNKTESKVDMTLLKHTNFITGNIEIPNENNLGLLINEEPNEKVSPLGKLLVLKDDIPKYERLSIKNIQWLKYLNSWCLSAKKIGGLS